MIILIWTKIKNVSKTRFSKDKKVLKDFQVERDWEKFHNPKNLIMELSVEVSELVEIFQWVKQGG